MKLKNKASYFILIILIIIFLCGCANDMYSDGISEGDTEISVNIKVTNGKEIYADKTVSLKMKTPDLFSAVSIAMKQSGKSFLCVGGVFDAFNGVRSTQTNRWTGYINDKKIESYSEVKISQGDKIKFEYEEIK